MKRIISALLSLILVISVFSVIPFTASALEPLASYANLDENTCYEFDSGSGKLSIYSRKAGSQPMHDYSASGDNVSPFKDRTEIKKVVISYITAVGDLAFYGCTGITSVEFMSDDTTIIGLGAFYGCTSLSSVKFPWYLTTVRDEAFYGCTSLTEANLPDTVTIIKNSAFSGCSNLKKVNVTNPDCVLFQNAFMNCTSLTEITVPAGESVYGALNSKVFYGCTSLTRITFLPRQSAIDVGNSAFSGCTALKEIYYAGTKEQWDSIHWYPDNDAAQNATVHYNSIWGLCGPNAEFVYNPAEKVLTISGTGGTDTCLINPLQRAPWYHYKDEIESVVIEEGISAIGSNTFYDHSKLQSITLPNSLVFFHGGVFNNTPLFTDVYYMGTESEWEKLEYSEFSDKTVHFHEHSFGDWQITTPATCTVKGEKARSCSVCGKKETEEIPTKEHSWGAWTVTKAATCTAAGTRVHTCSVCGAEETGTIDATEHKMTFFAAKAATTSATGNKAYYECSVCGKLFADKEGKNETTLAKVTIAKLAVYTITYKLDGGKNGKNPASYNVTTATIALKNPTKTGYTFKGWYSDAKFKTKVTQIAKGSTGNKTFYAKWSKNTYNITYKLNSGKNASGNPKTYTVTTSTITLKAPTRKGYNFKGWYNGTKKVTKIAKGSTGNITLTAKWSVITYKITYKLNSGKNNSKNPKSYKVTSSVVLKAPTRKGYTFKGWYNGSKKVTQIKKGSVGNITLTAKWKKK